MAGTDDRDVRLVAYADGELDEDAARAVEAELATSAEARRLLGIHRETASLLKAAFPESRYAGGSLPPAPAGRARPGPHLLARPWAGAVAASLLLGCIGYGAGSLWPAPIAAGPSRMLAEIAEYHALYSRETRHLVEADASEAEHIRAWLGPKVGRAIAIPDLSAAGLTFAGARLVALEGQPVAALMYTRPDGLPVAFCILSAPAAGRGMLQAEREGVGVASWGDGTHRYVVVGEAPPERLRHWVGLVQRQI
ncbi:anti-sigma factor family protein [Paracraurococcus ruber]|uniref:Anti-sigma factor n=1 Tax=Paracraurococcus ruber TaxID=77675 RepID=A0ABS1D4K2_9PROT|nr:anti-sigma factor [Paracraurococcus ruber]MBK1661734.1 hypothetical protein [Paracraurococcus ruber]TDG27413.1 anti-sigma factor [Paracraurococcus ruber]